MKNDWLYNNSELTQYSELLFLFYYLMENIQNELLNGINTKSNIIRKKKSNIQNSYQLHKTKRQEYWFLYMEEGGVPCTSIKLPIFAHPILKKILAKIFQFILFQCSFSSKKINFSSAFNRVSIIISINIK